MQIDLRDKTVSLEDSPYTRVPLADLPTTRDAFDNGKLQCTMVGDDAVFSSLPQGQLVSICRLHDDPDNIYIWTFEGDVADAVKSLRAWVGL